MKFITKEDAVKISRDAQDKRLDRKERRDPIEGKKMMKKINRQIKKESKNGSRNLFYCGKHNYYAVNKIKEMGYGCIWALDTYRIYW